MIGKPKVSGLIHLGALGISRELHCWFMLGLLFEQMPTPYRGRCSRFRRTLFISRWVERKRIGGSDGFAKWVAAPAGQYARGPFRATRPDRAGQQRHAPGGCGPVRQGRRAGTWRYRMTNLRGGHPAKWPPSTIRAWLRAVRLSSRGCTVIARLR